MQTQKHSEDQQKKKEKKKKHHHDRDQSDKKKKKRDRSGSEKKKDKKYKRSRSRQRKDDYTDKYRPKHKRSRSNSKKRKYDRDYRDYDRKRGDRNSSWKKGKDWRFDSPPKSDESNISDHPEKIDKLNKVKAEKQLVSSKADRKLYLGNLPPNITSNQMMEMLNNALKKMEINITQDGKDSIISAWISPDGVGHYAFVEFATAQEATNALALNGASLYGYQLKLGRPKQFIEYHKQLLSEFGSDANIDTIMRKVEAMGGFGEKLGIVQQRLVCPPTKILVLKHIVTVEELAIDEEYQQIHEDVTQMAKRHGDVIKVVIPRPKTIDLEQMFERVKGLGYIFIEYKTTGQANYARKQFIKHMFAGRSVACSFFNQARFEAGELDIIEKIIIDF